MGYRPQAPVHVVYTDATDYDDGRHSKVAIDADLLVINGKLYNAKVFVDILEEFNNLNRCPRCKFKFRRLEGGCSLASCNFSEQEKS